MRLGLKLFCCYLLVFLACFYWPMDWVVDTLKTRFYESLEEPLVDQANILAALVGREMEAGLFDPARLAAGFEGAYLRTFDARIYEMQKTAVDVRVYITDTSGRIVFDSKGYADIGEDYSQWRDVHLTLQGAYGARTSKDTFGNPDASVFYVAAPIRVGGDLAGVLTVAKPTTNIQGLIERAKPQIYGKGLLAAAVAALLCFIVSVWVTRPIKRLTRYADAIRSGRRATLPRLDSSEIGDMGQAFEKMREALEGKKYVEQYIQTLTHEIKSPLSAIRGAAELLGEEMPAERREGFLANIRNESARIQQIVDRMLELSALENRRIPPKKEALDIRSIVRTVLESKQLEIGRKGLSVDCDLQAGRKIKGDAFLLHQAVANLVQNSIDFSLPGGRIGIAVRVEDQMLVLKVEDDGAGIPDYARDRIFEKFFSLNRPASGNKSTGLGLNLVKEVATLHDGRIVLENRPEGGARAVLALPV